MKFLKLCLLFIVSICLISCGAPDKSKMKSSSAVKQSKKKRSANKKKEKVNKKSKVDFSFISKAQEQGIVKINRAAKNERSTIRKNNNGIISKIELENISKKRESQIKELLGEEIYLKRKELLKSQNLK